MKTAVVLHKGAASMPLNALHVRPCLVAWRAAQCRL